MYVATHKPAILRAYDNYTQWLHNYYNMVITFCIHGSYSDLHFFGNLATYVHMSYLCICTQTDLSFVAML